MNKSSIKKKSGKKSGSNNSNIVVFCMLTLLFVGAAIFSYCKSNNINIKEFTINNFLGKNLTNDIYAYKKIVSTISYDPMLGTKFDTAEGYIVQSTRHAIRFLNKKGQGKKFFSVAMNNPTIKVVGSHTVVADVGGKQIFVFNGIQKVWSKEIDDIIINLDINDKGYISVIHKAKRHKSAVTLYNNLGFSLFTIGKAEHNVLLTKFSRDGEGFVLDMLNSSGVRISSLLEFFDMDGNSIGEKYKKEDTIFPSVNYLQRESLLVIGDSQIIFLDKNKVEKWKIDVKGKIFTSNICRSKYPVVAVSREVNEGVFSTNKSDIRIYNTEGEQNVNFEVDEQVRIIECYEDNIAIATSKKVYVITYTGNVLGQYKSENDITNIKFLDEDEMLIVTKINALVLNLD